MKSLSNLTAKSIKLAIKKRHTLKDLCEEYQCEEKELVSKICGIYSRNEQEQRDIIRNLKAKPRKRTAKKVTSNIIEEIPEVVDEPLEPELPVATEDSCQVESIDDLRGREAELSEEVMEEEKHYESKAAERRDCRTGLRKIEEQISDLEANLKILSANYEEVVQKINEITADMNATSDRRRKILEQLDSVRDKISEAERVSVFVMNDEIKYESGAPFDIDDSGFEFLIPVLMEDELCLELRGREIRLLARVLKVREHASRSFEILFDNGDLEAVYELMIERDNATTPA